VVAVAYCPLATRAGGVGLDACPKHISFEFETHCSSYPRCQHAPEPLANGPCPHPGFVVGAPPAS